MAAAAISEIQVRAMKWAITITIYAWTETTGGTGGIFPPTFGVGDIVSHIPQHFRKKVSAPKIWGVWGWKLEKGSQRKTKVFTFIVL
jgi:hypothetical protein